MRANKILVITVIGIAAVSSAGVFLLSYDSYNATDGSKESSEKFLPGQPDEIKETKWSNNSFYSNKSLTEEEKNEAVTILKNDYRVQDILKNAEWNVQVGGWEEQGFHNKGAFILLRFEQPQWIEGEFYDPNSERHEKINQWAGSVHAYVDLTKNNLVGLAPTGISRPPDNVVASRVPQGIEPQTIHLAEEVVLDSSILRETLGHSTSYRITLNGIQEIGEYDGKVAFFTIYGENGSQKQGIQQKVMIAVSLENMEVVEKYSGIITEPPK